MKIKIKNATKIIRKAVILKDIQLELESGMIYGLQGPNGGGKTMLMRLIAGLIRPNRGTVFVDGKELGKELDFPPSVGLLIENPGFLPNYTGFKNLKLLAQLQGRADTEQIRQTLTEVGLNPDDSRKYRKYSLGMKQRLGIAAVLMEKPDLILLDEPTHALDEEGVEQICALIRRERERGALIIMSCHDAKILESLADQIITVVDGDARKKAVS